MLAILFSLAPFVAGVIAVLSARRDVRMLWMAVAATLVARVVLAAAAARWGATRGALAAAAAATVVAAGVAVLLGARAVFGVGAVAVVLAGCATVGAVLGRRPVPAA